MTRIYDPLHGFIEITPLIKRFIDTEEFQRLRDLKQLGVTTFVFPSANHTRFEHSLGVSYYAGMMMQSLIANGAVIDKKYIELVRLAGLLHDIGHGPYSHLYDDYVKSPNACDHEERGCNMIKYIVNRYSIDISAEDLEIVLHMIHPPDDKKYDWKYQIVANKVNQLDVDKLDYIQRDCHYLGMKCGGEYSRIIKDAMVFDVEEGTQICWPVKLQYEIFQLFATRYRLHKQVYNHPNVKACEFVIIDMLKKVASKVNLALQGDSIIYCKYVNDERMKLFTRNHSKFVGELTFTNCNDCKECKPYIKYMEDNNIKYQKLILGFGGKDNPLNHIKYYKDDVVVDTNPTSFSFMIPSECKETLLRVYVDELGDNMNDVKMHYNKMLNIYNNDGSFD